MAQRRQSESLIRQNYFRLILPWPIKNADIANSLHQFTAQFLRQFGEDRISGFAIPNARFDFDEFVNVQSRVQLLAHARSQPMLADHNHWVERMREATQVLSLFFGKGHR